MCEVFEFLLFEVTYDEYIYIYTHESLEERAYVVYILHVVFVVFDLFRMLVIIIVIVRIGRFIVK